MLEVKNLLGGGKKGIEFFDGGKGVLYYQDTDVPRKVTKIESVMDHVTAPDAQELVIADNIPRFVCYDDQYDYIYVARQVQNGSTYQLSLSRYNANSGQKVSDGSPLAVVNNSAHFIMHMQMLGGYIYAVNQNGSIYKINPSKYFFNSSSAVEVIFNNTSYPNALVVNMDLLGRILIVNTGKYLEIFDINGAFLGGFSTNADQCKFVGGLAQRSECYVVDLQSVKKFSESGTLMSSYDVNLNTDTDTFSGSKIMAACTDNAYIYVSGVSMGKSGVASKRFIEKFDADLNKVFRIELQGSTTNYDVHTFTVDEDGYIYQSDGEFTLRKVSPAGKVVWSFSGGHNVCNGFFVDYFRTGRTLDVRYLFYKTGLGYTPMYKLPVAQFGGNIAYFE